MTESSQGIERLMRALIDPFEREGARGYGRQTFGRQNMTISTMNLVKGVDRLPKPRSITDAMQQLLSPCERR